MKFQLLAMAVAAGFEVVVVKSKTIILSDPDNIKDATKIDKAIREATDEGAEPGIVVIDGANGNFVYDSCDIDSNYNRTIHVNYSDLTIRGINDATIENCQIGIQIDMSDVPLNNILIDGITFRPCSESSGFRRENGGIENFHYHHFHDKKYAQHTNINIQNNKVVAPNGFGINLFQCINCTVTNNTIRVKDKIASFPSIDAFYFQDVSNSQVNNNKIIKGHIISWKSNNNKFNNNNMKNTKLNIRGSSNIVFDNIVDNVELEACSDTTIESNVIETFVNGIRIFGCDETNVMNNKITSFYLGIFDSKSSRTSIYNNEIEICKDDEQPGIGFFWTTTSEARNNIINADPAIELFHECNDNKIINNVVDGEIIVDPKGSKNIIRKNKKPEKPMPNMCGVTVLMQDREDIVDRKKLYFSDAGVYLFQQKNGRLKLVVGKPGDPLYDLWKSGYRGKRGGGYYTRLQGDGNLVTRPGSQNVINPRAKSVWSTNTAGQTQQYGERVHYMLALRNDKKRLSIIKGSPESFGWREVWYESLNPIEERV